MSLSRQILIAVACGTATGLFAGDRMAVLQPVADGYVKLLQMTVLPYIALTLIGGLGALNRDQAARVGSRVGVVLLVLWSVALLGVFSLPLMFPVIETASFFSTTLLDGTAPFNLIDLYIPSNPFHALANNIVPAVVLFSALLGVALMGVAGKETAVAVIQTLNAAVARLARFVVALTPYGLFAIAAITAGTLDRTEAAQLEIYLACYLTVSIFLSMWVLPGLVAALTPVPHAALLARNRDALVLAFATGSLLVTLPMLAEQARVLLREHTTLPEADERLPDLIVPAAYTFPSAGKLLSLGFVLFAAWFSGASISPGYYPALGATGVLALFGSVNAAVPFLLDMFRIPADTFQLYLATGIVSARFGTLLSAVHTLAVAILGSCAVAGVLRVDTGRLLRFTVTTLLLGAAILGGMRLVVQRAIAHPSAHQNVLTAMETLHDRRDAIVYRGAAPPIGAPTGPLVERVRERGRLRVGYFEESLPYVFTNAQGNLVGFDVDMALQLAADLGVGLEMVPADPSMLTTGLDAAAYDLLMSGVPVTAERAMRVLFTSSYLDETLAFVVLDHRRAEFTTWNAIRANPTLRIGVPAVPYYLKKIHAEVPGATLVIVDGGTHILDTRQPEIDALVLTAERGSAYTLLHPQYSVVVPQPRPLKVPLAYAVAGQDQEFARVVDTWIGLKRKDGTIDNLFAYWIQGISATTTARRWSIMDNVLGWGR